MESIQIKQGNEVIAERRTDDIRSRYGTPVWTILNEDPEPGKGIFLHGETVIPLLILGVRDGWLIVREKSGFLVGIIWSDGSFFAEAIIDENGMQVTKLSPGCRVQGTLHTGGLGSILF
ncbi:MAG: hypothetical protein PHG14_06710 [Desulfobacter postgatei]|uniref:hypothetical protein n=1 Tax=Desulfobacter postgatei TaxID=2293 RepID=UPI0023F48F70|nr:hypothetical protein [Desulfobacter postgatei]MDD4273402.1 hypothetical protein [Desulfobacter postgatei]